MDAQTNRLMRTQIMAKLRPVQQATKRSPRPRMGWIRSIRQSLRMTGAQLGKRLGVSKQRVAQIEKDEVLGNVTLKTMHQVAEAMDCSFAYWLVPNKSLQETLREQARKVAQRTLNRTSHTMALEGQDISDQDKTELLEATIEALLSDMKTQLWEDD